MAQNRNNNLLARLRNLGPGAMIAAAFVGPGTVTTTMIAGAQYGYGLIWTLLFATLAAIILQEMTARLGIIGRLGLGQAITETLKANNVAKWFAITLIGSALFIGNAAYEGGNIAGAVLGLSALVPNAPQAALIAAIGLSAGGILWFGQFKHIQQILLVAVLFMVISFGATLLMIGPDWNGLMQGALRPKIPDGALMIVVALIGTTIVPYNLFLHAAAARDRWPSSDSISDARFDTSISIGLGGLVSILIMASAAASLFGSGLEINSAGDMARQLEPIFGEAARWLIGIGLFAAGLSSAITAPLATSIAAAELFNLDRNPQATTFRLVAFTVLGCGLATALAGFKPVAIILFAQFANGLLLPLIAVFLLYAANQHALLGTRTNGLLANIAGGTVVLLTVALGGRLIYNAIAAWL